VRKTVASASSSSTALVVVERGIIGSASGKPAAVSHFRPEQIPEERLVVLGIFGVIPFDDKAGGRIEKFFPRHPLQSGAAPALFYSGSQSTGPAATGSPRFGVTGMPESHADPAGRGLKGLGGDSFLPGKTAAGGATWSCSVSLFGLSSPGPTTQCQ
jgi:hypothetical protein